MAGATISQIKNRLVTMGGLISGITNSYDNYIVDGDPATERAFVASELPAFVVQVGPATNTRRNERSILMSREYRLILHVQHTTEDVTYPDNAALEAVEPFLLSVPLYFLERRRLENSDTGLAVTSSIPGDNRPSRIIREAAIYWGAVFTLTVETIHSN